MVRGTRQTDDVTRQTRRARSWEVTASNMHRSAVPAAHAPRTVYARSRAVADLQRPVAQPAAARDTAERPQLSARTNWRMWLVVAVGSASLVAAGYLGALVQLGVSAPQRHTIPRAAVPVSPPKQASSATPTPTRIAPATVVSHGPARVSARRPKARRVDAKLAALATADLERELYAGPAIPEAGAQPSREAVQQALLAMRPRLAACSAGRHGIVDARVSIAGSGRVTRALIQGDFAGTREGSCMALALRAATVQSFAGPVFQVQFPFVL